jgi:hypothetical protein
MKHIQEMPWIKYGDSVFDLHIESFKDSSDFIQFLKDILTGKSFTDKYDNIISLQSIRQKLIFLKSLKKDKVFLSYVNRKFNDNEKELIKILLSII